MAESFPEWAVNGYIVQCGAIAEIDSQIFYFVFALLVPLRSFGEHFLQNINKTVKEKNNQFCADDFRQNIYFRN